MNFKVGDHLRVETPGCPIGWGARWDIFEVRHIRDYGYRREATHEVELLLCLVKFGEGGAHPLHGHDGSHEGYRCSSDELNRHWWISSEAVSQSDMTLVAVTPIAQVERWVDEVRLYK
jgi:hypothetical protein